MKIDTSIMNLFNDIKMKEDTIILSLDNKVLTDFKNNFGKFSDQLFFRVASNCGGIIIDNWIRLYGCGELNVVNKNNINKEFDFDIIIGEDVCGGIFSLKDNIVYYFAPDSLDWEMLNIYYSDFLNWALNNADGVSQFYETFRWSNWKQFCNDIKLNQGISFYPQLCFKNDIEDRSKKIVSIDEIIKMNFDLAKQIN